MNDFKEILDGLRNVIKIDDTKKEIQELEKKLDTKRKLLDDLKKLDNRYNDIANNINDIDIKKIPQAMQDEFKELVPQLIKLGYISITDVYNLK